MQKSKLKISKKIIRFISVVSDYNNITERSFHHVMKKVED